MSLEPDADAPTIEAAFLQACWLDVAVRKPGNVSLASAGHGMQAAQFEASARAAAGPLCRPGARVGERIDAAGAASWAAAGCNTNLGILLLCAPIARAAERAGALGSAVALRAATEAVLADLDLADARAAYRAIARANPGGLGAAPEQDVQAGDPGIDLRAAMALAADRDSIALQYRNGFAELFELGLPPLTALGASPAGRPPTRFVTSAVQRVYLGFLAALPDSHIVRKHGAALAHSVMRSAQAWRARAEAGDDLDADARFQAWDLELKAAGLNPGTSADMTVAALFAAGLLEATPPAG